MGKLKENKTMKSVLYYIAVDIYNIRLVWNAHLNSISGYKQTTLRVEGFLEKESRIHRGKSCSLRYDSSPAIYPFSSMSKWLIQWQAMG